MTKKGQKKDKKNDKKQTKNRQLCIYTEKRYEHKTRQFKLKTN